MRRSNLREREIAEIETIFGQYGLSGGPLRAVVGALTSDRKRWVEFMMRFELGLERPDPERAPVSAATIAASYLSAVSYHSHLISFPRG